MLFKWGELFFCGGNPPYTLRQSFRGGVEVYSPKNLKSIAPAVRDLWPFKVEPFAVQCYLNGESTNFQPVVNFFSAGGTPPTP